MTAIFAAPDQQAIIDGRDTVFVLRAPNVDSAMQGPAATISIGNVTTGSPPSVTNVGTSGAAILDFVLPVGVPGPAATIAVGTVTTGAAGTNASVTNAGTTSAAVFNFTIPRGAQGVQGIQGPQGEQGEKGAQGDQGPAGQDGAQGIQGIQGIQGEQGPAGADGEDGEKGDKGEKGDPGDQGPAATIAVGTVATGAAGSSATVTNAGTATDAVLNFAIPRGNTGLQGDQGPAATIAVGTVTTGAPGSNVIVSNSGTSGAAVLDFTIPRGQDGTGTGSVTSVAASGGVTGFEFTGGPITGAGTLTLTISNAATARSALGLSTKAQFNTALTDGDFLFSDMLGAANGVAPLDANAKLALSTLGDAPTPSGDVIGYTLVGVGGVKAWQPAAINPIANSMPYRGGGGTLSVGTPAENEHAATKGYVDTGLAAKINNSIFTGGQQVLISTSAGTPSRSDTIPANSLVGRPASGGIKGMTAAEARSAAGLGSIATLNAPSGDVVGTTDTQTLSSKTLTAPVIDGYTEGMATASGAAFSPNLAADTLFLYSTTGNATITLPAATVGKSFTIFVKYGGAHTLAWAGATRLWLNGEVPTPTSESGKIDMFSFVCIEAGTWLAVPSGNNF